MPLPYLDFAEAKSIFYFHSILYLGGLEQRKGVLTLAKAIPIILDKYPKVIFRFIGADTPSNDKNILTSEYIKEIVPKKYHKN